jgi:hypothetical protein
MKFFGKVGYCESIEGSGERAGIWEDVVTEREYYGDVLSNNRRYDAQTDSVLDNLNVNNRISIVADAYAYEHFFQMKYVEWMDCKWKVTQVEVQRPRLILHVGGVYNGPTY